MWGSLKPGPPSCLLLRRGAGAARGQLLKIILKQADFYTATAHALRLLAVVGGSGRCGSVAHTENVNPVNRDFVVLDQVTHYGVGHLARGGNRGLSLTRREALHFDDVSALALHRLGHLIEG